MPPVRTYHGCLPDGLHPGRLNGHDSWADSGFFSPGHAAIGRRHLIKAAAQRVCSIQPRGKVAIDWHEKRELSINQARSFLA